MTGANARYHLGVLHSEGLVEVVGTRPAVGKGRPAQVYSLSDQARGNNLAVLAAALLDELVLPLPETDQEPALRKLAMRLSKQVEGNTDANKPGLRMVGAHLTHSLKQAVQRLNELGYEARWEARVGAPRVILGRCPYASILNQHPELCRLDAALLETMLGVSVELIARQVVDERGLRSCSFRL